MLIKFNQKWAEEKYEQKIRELIHFVKGSRRCADLLVKVFIYTKAKLRTKPSGNYRSLQIHGFYETESQYISRGISSIITVKLPEDFSEQSFIYIFAHEWKHYLDFREKLDKNPYRWWEKRANKFACKKVEEWKLFTSTASRPQING